MNEADFEIHGTWRTVEDGQEYEAAACTKNTNRVVARATGHVSYNSGLDEMLGPGGRAEVEKAIRDTCKQLALKVPG